jgi:probable F420-dependent oxidoreductase
MQIGIHYSPTAKTMNVVELARAVEDLGFESYFLSEHTHIPVNASNNERQRGPIPRAHAEGLDPWVSLSMAAAVTSRIRLGTSVTLLTQHDPIVLAKVIATLDVLSGGRVVVGVGVGSVVDETRNHGVQPEDRWRVLRERVLAMKEIWTHDEAEFHGRFVNFDPIFQWPKPLQKPHPPVIIGGSGSHVLSRAVAYGDGWMPTAGTAGRPGPSFLERVAELRALAAEKGRTELHVGVSDADPDPKVLESYREAAIERVLLRVPAAGTEEVMPVLRMHAELLKEFG